MCLNLAAYIRMLITCIAIFWWGYLWDPDKHPLRRDHWPWLCKDSAKRTLVRTSCLSSTDCPGWLVSTKSTHDPSVVVRSQGLLQFSFLISLALQLMLQGFCPRTNQKLQGIFRITQNAAIRSHTQPTRLFIHSIPRPCVLCTVSPIIGPLMCQPSVETRHLLKQIRDVAGSSLSSSRQMRFFTSNDTSPCLQPSTKDRS